MGFFDNLIDGVKSAGSWVLDNAGSIIDTASTVAELAASFAATSGNSTRGVSDDLTNLLKFHQNLVEADAGLQAAAKQVADALQPPAALGVPEDTQTTISGGVSGIWTNPVLLQGKGLPSPAMYNDLSKFLGTMEWPAQITLGGVLYDLASFAAESLFVQPTTKERGSLTTPHSFSTTDDNKNFYAVGHVYYTLPMGQMEDTNHDNPTIHSALYAKMTTDTASYEAKLKAGSTRVLSRRARAGDGTATGWLSTLSITWPNATVAASVNQSGNPSPLQTALTTDASDIIVQSSLPTGVSQVLKIWHPFTTTPYTAVNEVAHACADAIASTTGAAQVKNSTNQLYYPTTANVALTASTTGPQPATP